MRHILPVDVKGTFRTEASNGARSFSERVSRCGFYQGARAIVRDLDLTADLLAERLAGDNRLTNGELARKVGGILDPMHRQHPGDAGIQFLVTDADGLVIAATPKTPAVGRPLLDILGAGQPLTTFGASAGVLEIPLADGTQVFATVRSLNAPLGQL